MVGRNRQIKTTKTARKLTRPNAEFFVFQLSDYQFNYKSEKINSIARLTRIGIPTVPYPHFLSQEAFLFYLKNKKLPLQALKELKTVFLKIKELDYNITVRPSVFAPKISGFEFLVPNTVNILTFKQMTEAICHGYAKIIAATKNPEGVEFVYIIQGFYTSNRCGLAQSEDGTNHVHIEACFGEHSQLITRGEVKPDIYRVNKKSRKITIKEVADKEFTLKPLKTGLIKISLPPQERKRQVLNNHEIKTLVKYTLLMEKEYGPQEIEWAVLRTGQLIFQASRNAKIKKLKTIPTKNFPIFPKKTKGEIIFLISIKENQNLTDKIVVTNNLNIDFITKLTYQNKPAGIILTRGSLTAHAVTVIREAKIPSVLATNLDFTGKKFAQIMETGEIELK